jgi:hypothetical protein
MGYRAKPFMGKIITNSGAVDYKNYCLSLRSLPLPYNGLCLRRFALNDFA